MTSPGERQPAIHQAGPPTEPLSEADARRADAEALHRTLETSDEASESRRRGRIEAQTRQISEDVTRQAQERLRDEHVPLEQPSVPVSGADERRDALDTIVHRRALPEPTTIERVLVPLDGTAYAERALPYSSALAMWANASIVLAHVQEREPRRARALLSKALDGATTDMPARNEQDAIAYLTAKHEGIATGLSSATRVETINLSADTVADGLAAIAGRTSCDMAVLATHARQGLERRILGSVGDELVQRTHMPMLLIPPGLNVSTTQSPTFRRVLVPLDGSVLAEQALAPVLALAEHLAPDDKRGMEIVLYYVADSYVAQPEGARYTTGVRERLLRLDLPDAVAITATAMVGSPPGSITSAAIHGLITEPSYPTRFDLVAMATHGRGGVQRWLYGSVAEYVLSHITVPTLLVHPERTDI